MFNYLVYGDAPLRRRTPLLLRYFTFLQGFTCAKFSRCKACWCILTQEIYANLKPIKFLALILKFCTAKKFFHFTLHIIKKTNIFIRKGVLIKWLPLLVFFPSQTNEGSPLNYICVKLSIADGSPAKTLTTPLFKWSS